MSTETPQTAHTPEHPFVVPKFHPGAPKTKLPIFVLWGWHPNYPYWSKSCWEYPTKEEAVANREKLIVYHVKVIRHDETGYHEVADFPCEELHVWNRIANQKTHEQISEIHAASERINAMADALTGIQDPAGAIQAAREALEDASLQIQYLHERFAETGSGNAILARITAALAKLSAISPKV